MLWTIMLSVYDVKSIPSERGKEKKTEKKNVNEMKRNESNQN